MSAFLDIKCIANDDVRKYVLENNIQLEKYSHLGLHAAADPRLCRCPTGAPCRHQCRR